MSRTIFLIAGESSSGKDLLVNTMCEKFNMKKLISYATRPRRPNEENTHIFIEPQEVPKYENDMIASTVINGITYFATSSQLHECDFYIIDRNGIVLLKDRLQNDSRFKFVTIYITAPFDIRYKRALKRGDVESTFLCRSMSEQTQFLMFKMNTEFDYAIVNYDVDKSISVLEKIIEIERRNDEN